MIAVLHIALSQYGIKEIVGETHNGEVLKYFSDIGHGWVKDDEMAWCSAFVNWCAMKAGFEFTGKLDARSWLNAGVQIDSPQLGDLVIFWRKNKNSIYGHVGFFMRENGDYIYILGGNQNNQVNISGYPKYQLLGYRRLKPILL